ncbi:MAG TPA: FtsX-like permease family protein, partial [Chitinophagaceae bacterium]|nr:FtsX-like permease family protein [Chitinophagaceae bacterium]
ITLLRDKLVKGSYINGNDNAVLIAQGLAERLRLNVGDTIILIGQGYHGSTAAGKYPVKGIVKFGSPDLNDKALFMPLAATQDLYSAYGMITSFILSLDDTGELDATATSVQNNLGQDYEVMTWEQMMPDIRQHIQSDTNSMKYITGILYLLVCFGIFGTLLMMMVERKFEMGMLVAIGMKKTKMVGLFLFESVFSLLLGCVLGIIASIPVVYYFNRHPLRFGGETAEAYSKFGFEPIFPTSLNPSNFIDQGLIVLIIGLMLSLYPIYKVIRLNPVTAMKR